MILVFHVLEIFFNVYLYSVVQKARVVLKFDYST